MRSPRSPRLRSCASTAPFRPHPLRHAPRHRVAAGGARDHRRRETPVHRHDDRQQRSPNDPREGSASAAAWRGRAEEGAAAGTARPGGDPGGSAGTARRRAAAARAGQAVEQHPNMTPEQARQASYEPWEFRSEKWGSPTSSGSTPPSRRSRAPSVPVLWVGLASQRGKSSQDSAYLNELYRSRAEKAGIVYVDIWDGFVDEAGRYSPQGPDYEGQIRRLRTGDGVYFTKFGARKLAHYVEARNSAHHRQQGPAGRAADAGRSGPAGAGQAGRPRATAVRRTGRAAHGLARRAGRTDGRRPRPVPLRTPPPRAPSPGASRSRRRADGPTISAGRAARSMSSRPRPSRERPDPNAPDAKAAKPGQKTSAADGEAAQPAAEQKRRPRPRRQSQCLAAAAGARSSASSASAFSGRCRSSLPGLTPQLGSTRVATLGSAKLGQARVPVQSIFFATSLFQNGWTRGSS